MKFVDEFRDTEKAKSLTKAIQDIAKRLETKSGAKSGTQQTRPLQIMEFCGGHTHTLSLIHI